MFVGSASYGENTAILCKTTGKIYYTSIWGDFDSELPEEERFHEEDFNPQIHLYIPHKNEFGLGRDLVLEFTEEHLPEKYEYVSRIFRKKGAYGRFKNLLEERGLLQTWYDLENARQRDAIRQWCQQQNIPLLDEAV